MNLTSGFLLINKPQGPTSHDIINTLRRITDIRQIGHAGTLDPFADGLLIVAVGASTKLLQYFVGLDKKYRATLFLGATSDTYDRTGAISTPMLNARKPNLNTIHSALTQFIGPQLQTPPMYSAKKVGGKKLYTLARQGKEIERKPHKIDIYSIEFIDYVWPRLTIDVHCGTGTYIRALGHDIGQKLGCGAYVESLTRTAIGDFSLNDTLVTDPGQLKIENWTDRLILSQQANSCVMIFGVFDLIHKGHEYMFRQTKKFCKNLIVVITTDNNVKKLKHCAPQYSQEERIKQLSNIPSVDKAIIGHETDYFLLINQYNPNLICLGYDQHYSETQLRKELKEHGLTTHVLRLDPYKPELYKSHLLKKSFSINSQAL